MAKFLPTFMLLSCPLLFTFVCNVNSIVDEIDSDDPEVPDETITLSDADFPQIILSFPYSLVMFYAPRCPHCEDLEPEFVEAASVLKNDRYQPVTFVKVDCTWAGRRTCDKFSIKQFPSLKIFKKGKFVADYKGKTDKSSQVVKYMRDKVVLLNKRRKPKDEM